MTIGQLTEQLQQLGISRFCFRFKHGRYEAMVVNQDGDMFGLAEDTVEEAAASLVNALKAKQILGGDGWNEFLSPNLN